MKKQNIIPTIIVTFVMVIVAMISLVYLPAEIPVQWNENGVSSCANKFLIFVFPLFSVIFLIVHAQKSKETSKKLDFISLLVSLILFAAQSIITLNALEYINMMSLDYKLMQTIALLIIGLIICVCGNHIPKFMKNYYCGVKTSFAYSDSNVWLKTQRFAGKLWFVLGIVIMLLSFIQWEMVSLLVVFIILILIAAPRIYSGFEYKKIAGTKGDD